MLFYILNLLLISSVAYVLREKKNVMYILVFTWLFLLGALRGKGVGADYYNYKYYFEFFAGKSWLQSYGNIEKGYIWLNKAISLFTNNFQWLLAVCSFLALIGVIFFTKKYSGFPIISIWVYIAMGCYQSTFTRLRQAIAISIILFAYQYILEKKFWKFTALVISAAFFHRSALITILLYPMFHWKKTISSTYRIFIVIFTMLGIAFSIFSGPLMNYIVSVSGYYLRYSNSISGEGMWLLLVYLLIFTYIVYCSSYTDKANPNMRLLIILASFSAIFQGLAGTIEILNRLTNYFSIPLIILLPNTITLFEKKSRTVAKTVLMSLVFIFYVYSLSLDKFTVPYRFFW